MPQDGMNQLFLRALALEEQGKLEEAIEFYQLIKRESSPKFFAQAQYNLALIWQKKGEQEKAIAIYETIQREDNPKAFAKALFNLGFLWEEKGDQEKAIAAYEAIHREDDKETFAKAQYNLAVMWEEKGEQKKAAATYKTIQREDYPKAFARAQLGLAEIWEEKGEQEKAIAAYEVIQREDDKQIFALAQWNVGIIWAEKGEQEKEVAAYKAIHREDSPKLFALAQWNLAKVWADNGKWKKSVNILLNIKRSDSQHLYSRITEMLLNSFIPELIKKGHRAGKFVNNIFERVKFDYRHDILKFIFKSKDIHLLKILDRVTEILNELKIETLASEDFEKNIAHYTRPLIGFSLLNPTEEKSSSKFRLSTIKGVNDPTEGTILKDFLNYGKKSEDDLITFISCFTFNHDSLNQFRLYGKEKGQEASGISLVFERDKFFNQEVSAFNTLSHQNAPFKTEVFLDNKKIDEKQGESNKPNPILVSKLPLYRCIYLESYSDNKPFYLQLAQREELTFYREDEKSKPSTRWKIYKKKIDQIEKNVREKLTEIKEEISKLSSDEKTHEILDKILLPLRYLVKHSAFKEEQECRIIYIASICDDKIQMNPEQGQMYVEYEQDVKKAIHKIYLSSGSEKYKDHFRKLLNDEKGNMVMSSTNPFRVKSS